VGDAIREVCQELSQKIIRDAEGAAHFVTVDVSGLRTRPEAKLIAKAICEGALVKTAITGNDPNWGRIVSAAGYTSVEFREEDVSLWVNGTLLYQAGAPAAFDAAAVSKSMASGEVHIDLRFALGTASAKMWTSDLTQEYVRLNSEYTT
jgi:glutamate N-acetyltransferase/amino-acid N-acetyltransferase